MRDPFSWSFPIGYVSGIAIRVHFLFPIVMLGFILREVFKSEIPGTWIDATVLMLMIFVSVLLHEFGHCIAARRVGGDADTVLLWPLGGLARTQTPHNAGANCIVAIGGPLVNLLLFLVAALVLAFAFEYSVRPSINPIWYPYRNAQGLTELSLWSGENFATNHLVITFMARLFWVNWILFLFNVVLVGLPFDSGRILQSALWNRFGYHEATLYAIYSGFVIMVLMLCVGIIFNEVLLFPLAWFTFQSCQKEWEMLESGGDDSIFGYDFSQGYTSLEKNEEATVSKPPRRKQANFIKRWLQRRAARKMLLEQERQDAEDRRMDELLEKIQRYGKASLTEEEQRFLKRVADRYRNKPS